MFCVRSLNDAFNAAYFTTVDFLTTWRDNVDLYRPSKLMYSSTFLRMETTKHNTTWENEVNGDYLCLSWDSIDVASIIARVRSERYYSHHHHLSTWLLLFAPVFVNVCSAGAVSSFLGTTRDTFEDLVVTSLEYEAYNDMALQSLQELLASVTSSL